jgi:hypothetical protein
MALATFYASIMLIMVTIVKAYGLGRIGSCCLNPIRIEEILRLKKTPSIAMVKTGFV